MELRVLVLTPLEQEGRQVRGLLSEAGIGVELCTDTADLCTRLREGAGALIVDGSVVQPGDACPLKQMLRTVPAGSRLSVLVIDGGHAEVTDWHANLEQLGELASIVPLDRPLRLPILLAAVRSALSARKRQYEVRDELLAHQRSEERLREDQEHFRTLTEHMQASYGIVQGERFVYANQYFADMSGYTVAELRQMSFPSWFTPTLSP